MVELRVILTSRRRCIKQAQPCSPRSSSPARITSMARAGSTRHGAPTSRTSPSGLGVIFGLCGWLRFEGRTTGRSHGDDHVRRSGDGHLRVWLGLYGWLQPWPEEARRRASARVRPFERLFPRSLYEPPGDWVFERSGVLQLPVGLFAGRAAWRAPLALRQADDERCAATKGAVRGGVAVAFLRGPLRRAVSDAPGVHRLVMLAEEPIDRWQLGALLTNTSAAVQSRIRRGSTQLEQRFPMPTFVRYQPGRDVD